jgi:hypothetical protein
MRSGWNLFMEKLIATPRLNASEFRLAIILARYTLGYRETERDLGEGLLRREGRFDGRTFERARDGLVEKGVIAFTPPATRGRGHRGIYRLLIENDDGLEDQSETPADEREMALLGPPAPARVKDEETPAQSPAQSPALERGRIEERVEKTVVEGELVQLLDGFDPSPTQLRLFAEAHRADPAGFKALVAQARAGKKPTALLHSLVGTRPLIAGLPPTDPGRLARWLADTGQLFDEDTASHHLRHDFGLTDDEYATALQEWRDYRDLRANGARR